MSSNLLRREKLSASAEAARNLSKVTPPRLERVRGNTWSFERRTERRAAGEAEDAFRHRVAAGLALYRGDFLADDDEWWNGRPREQLRERDRRMAGVA